jgi:RNA polymerase sigma-70 factor (ECF subfamily)
VGHNMSSASALSRLQQALKPAGSLDLASEKELALRAIRHDVQAFATLYDCYVAKIYHYVYFKVGNAPEAEDLTAQVFLQAWEAIDNYEWRNHPFSAWLFRIARNLVVDYHRARRDTVPLDEPDQRGSLTTRAGQPHPEQALQHLLAMDQVRKAILQLTKEQQEVIVLRFMEGYSTAEVARIMGKREGAIRGLQFRGLSALREMLNPSSVKSDEPG